MRVRCPAKINLDLRVGLPRADGFHPIRSWFVTVGLFDTLDFSPADDLSLTCDDPSIPADDRNLVWRAAAALRPPGGPGVAIHLAKAIPAGGGLGGGSSDAAATLVALNDFWRLGHDLDHLHAVAATLGSDVPFFLHGPSSTCTGRGEIVTPIEPPACRWAVLIMPGIHLSTPAVFRRFDELQPFSNGPATSRDRQEASSDLPACWTLPNGRGSLRGELEELEASRRRPAALEQLAQVVNDLERPAFDLSPQLSALRDSAEVELGRPVRMSGSGSTLFTLFDSESDASTATTRFCGVTHCRAVVAEICPKFDTI